MLNWLRRLFGKPGPIAIEVADSDFPLMHWLLVRLWREGHFEGHKIVPRYETDASP